MDKFPSNIVKCYYVDDKTFIGAKPFRIRFSKIDGFNSDYNGKIFSIIWFRKKILCHFQ